MSVYMVLLRLVHIGAGVFWAGAAVMVAAFIEPAVRASGPEGGRFMRRLVEQQRFSFFMSLAALLTALSGILLYWPVSGHLSLAWITSGPGLTLTIGSVAGLSAFAIGTAVNGPTARQIAAVGQEMQAAGGPPGPAQLETMRTLQARLRKAGVVDALLLAIAVAGMAIASYVR
jgi:hypothetical protein